MFLVASQYVLFTLVGILISVYIFFKNKCRYWKNQNVYSTEPEFPYGHAKDVVLGNKQFGILIEKLYEETRKHQVAGIYMFYQPYLIINDLEIAKNILVKDFVNFIDHGYQYDKKIDPISGHLFNVTGQMWKDLRCKLTPTFTPNKMKMMFETLKDCNSQMLIYLENHIKKENDIELREILSKLNTDVIGSCAFGIECNSFTDPDSEFRKMGKKIVEPSVAETLIRGLNFFIFNKCTTWLHHIFVQRSIQNFCYKIIKNTIKYREENNICRNDFLQILIELNKNGLINSETKDKSGTKLTTMQLAAQVYVFFLAGFETSANTASFALYELALNPDIQDAVRKDINNVLKQNNGNVTYNSIQQMDLLSKVIKETLRKYPPLPVLPRVCNKKYKIPNTDITIEKDTKVFIPIYGYHRNPEYFPDPDKFDPERFSPENEASRPEFSYMPFGEGPRICLGKRFGTMQTSLGLISILSKYKVSICDKTFTSVEFEWRNYLLSPTGGMWLKFTKIENA